MTVLQGGVPGQEVEVLLAWCVSLLSVELRVVPGVSGFEEPLM